MDFRTTLRAFHGNDSIKQLYLERVRAHRAADEIVQGVYWERGRGCAVGCTIHSADHEAYEDELGISQLIARVEDVLFERMALSDAKGWPERFLSAVPVGADLSMVWPKFALWMLTDAADGVIRFAKHDDVKAAVTRVAELYQLTLDGAEIDRDTWMSARRQARAAQDAAWSRRRDAWKAAAAAAAAAAEAAAAEAEAAVVEAEVAAAEAEAVEEVEEAVAEVEEAVEEAVEAVEVVEVVEAVEAAVEVAAAVDWWSDAAISARRAYALRASEQLLVILRESPVPSEVA